MVKRPALLMAVFALVSACGGGTAATTTTSPTTVAATTTTSLAPETTTTIHSAEACRLQDTSGRSDVFAGFPSGIDRIHPDGTIHATVLFVDFDDAPANAAPGEVYDALSPDTEMFFSAVSYGEMELILEPHLEWVRMSRPSTYYAGSILEWESHRDWLREAADLADDDVDFSQSSLLIVIANPEATEIAYGPVFLGYPSIEGGSSDGVIEVDGSQIANGVTSGADLAAFGYRWLAGSIGQAIGLPRLWNFEDGTGFTRPYSLMDDLLGDAPEFLAWERWRSGWIDDDQIVCAGGSEAEATLTAIEVPGGTKAVIIPTGETTAVAVESRRAIGYDEALDDPGVIVYLVDTSLPSGAGPLRMAFYPLGAGDSTTVDGVTVTVVAAHAEADEVVVSAAG